MTIASFFSLFMLLHFGCRDEWNPDQQFEREVQTLKTRRDQFQEERKQEAQQNLNSFKAEVLLKVCLLYTSPSPRDATLSRMPSSA